ncbi:MAG: hypothetical protein ACLQUT_02945 [Thermoleophilia bacterium]
MFDVPVTFTVATSVAHVVDRALYLQWLLGLQLIVCLVLGYLVARKTGRGLTESLAAGFLAAVVPVVGYAVMLAAYRWLPPLEATARQKSPKNHV